MDNEVGRAGENIYGGNDTCKDSSGSGTRAMSVATSAIVIGWKRVVLFYDCKPTLF